MLADVAGTASPDPARGAWEIVGIGAMSDQRQGDVVVQGTPAPLIDVRTQAGDGSSGGTNDADRLHDLRQA
jgi:hypothetical protein